MSDIGGGTGATSGSQGSSSNNNNNTTAKLGGNVGSNRPSQAGKNLAIMQQLFEKQHQQTNEVSTGTVQNPVIRLTECMEGASANISSLLMVDSNNSTGVPCDESQLSPSSGRSCNTPNTQQQGIYANRTGKSADQIMAALSRMQQQSDSTTTNKCSPSSDANVSSAASISHSSKPRGKNFDQMVKSNNVPVPTHLEADYTVPLPLSSIPIYHTSPAAAATNTAPAPAAVKPRGKDFQAMIQRAPEEILQSLPYVSTTSLPPPSHHIPTAITTIAASVDIGIGIQNPNPPRMMNSNPVWSTSNERPPPAAVVATHTASTAYPSTMMSSTSGSGPVSFYGLPPGGTHPFQYPPSMNNNMTMGPPLSMPSPKQPKPKRVKTAKPTVADANIFARNIAPGNTNTTTSDVNSITTSIEPLKESSILGPKLSTLLATVDPTGTYVLQEETEEQILHLVNDFVNSVVQQSMKLAKHRSSCSSTIGPTTPAIVNVDDVALALKKGWGMTIPGFATCDTPSQLLASGPASRILSHTSNNNNPTIGTTEESVQKGTRTLAPQSSGHGSFIQTSPMQSSSSTTGLKAGHHGAVDA